MSAEMKTLVDRFLMWKLPDDFRPDNGISYQRPNYAPNVDATPCGTNLLTATQAEAMLRHVLDLPACGCTGPDQCDGDCYPALVARAALPHP